MTVGKGRQGILAGRGRAGVAVAGPLTELDVQDAHGRRFFGLRRVVAGLTLATAPLYDLEHGRAGSVRCAHPLTLPHAPAGPPTPPPRTPPCTPFLA